MGVPANFRQPSVATPVRRTKGAPFRNNHRIVLNFNQKVETAYVSVRTCVIENIPATSAGIFDAKIAGHCARLSGIRLPMEGADGLHGFNKRLCSYQETCCNRCSL